MFEKEIKIRYDNRLVVGLITIALVLVLQIYPSFLIYDHISPLIRIVLALAETCVIFAIRRILLLFFVLENSGIEHKIQIKDILLPTGLFFVVFILHAPSWFASFACYSDEFFHVAGATFGQINILLKYRYLLLIGAIIVHSLFAFHKCRTLAIKFLNSNGPLFLGFIVSLIWIVGLELFPIAKHTWAIYRYPGFGKIYNLYIYLFTGLSLESFRIPSHLAHALTVVPFYFFSRNSGSSALTAALLTGVVLLSPFVHFYSGLLYLESLWLFMMITSFFFLQKCFSDPKNRTTHLLWFILFSNLAFFTRNVTLLLPVFILLGWVISLFIKIGNRDLKKKYHLPLSVCLAIAPMILWHTLFLINKHLHFTYEPQVSYFFRDYIFNIAGWFYWEGLAAYWRTMQNGIGIGFVVLGIFAIVYLFAKPSKSEFQIIGIISFLGYLLFMLGDYGWGKIYFGYGRFLFIPFVSIAILLSLFIGQMGDSKFSIFFAVFLGTVLLEHAYRFPFKPSKSVGLYGHEVIMHQQEFRKLVQDIKGEEKDIKIGIFGKDFGSEIISFTYTLLGKRNSMVYLDAKNPEKYRKNRYVWECYNKPAPFNLQKIISSNSKTFELPSILSKMSYPFKVKGIYIGPNDLECRKYEFM